MRTVPMPVTRRLWNVVRLQFANPFTAVWIPLMILSFIFIINYLIWTLVERYTAEGMVRQEYDPATGEVIFEANIINGGLGFLIIYMVVVAVQTMNLTFSYALSHGATRRDYYLGTAVFFVIISLGYATLSAVLGMVEQATDGWGYYASFFTVEYLGIAPGWDLWLFLVMMLLLSTFAGAAVATVYVRWRANGMLIFWGLVVVALVGVVWILSAGDQWPAIAEAAERAGPLGVTSWSLALTVTAAVVGYAVLRRATPRSA